ncbi:hypothetical protein V1460_30195 [Streptomyces sp. SCSIO 30461]|uniref:hypothetical protein n=1 Tax=Streptomyces sp. SCSIO 30461 TaxID=3118085 RepID=UPI0030D052DC
MKTKDSGDPAEQEWEWVVHAFGPQGPRLAEQLVAAVQLWDKHLRPSCVDPVLTVHPAATPDHLLPAGSVVDKQHCRLVYQWPRHNAAIPAPVHRTEEATTAVGREGA